MVSKEKNFSFLFPNGTLMSGGEWREKISQKSLQIFSETHFSFPLESERRKIFSTFVNPILSFPLQSVRREIFSTFVKTTPCWPSANCKGQHKIERKHTQCKFNLKKYRSSSKTTASSATGNSNSEMATINQRKRSTMVGLKWKQKTYLFLN